MTGWAAALLFLAVPAAAFSASSDARKAARLRGAGDNPAYVPHPALDMRAALPVRHTQQRRPGPPERTAWLAPQPSQNAPAFRRLNNTMGVHRWYAVARAGSRAVALVPGQAAQTQRLYLQKRAKIRGGQLGLGRDVGAAKLTVGYLLTNPGRDPLVPYYSGHARQNLAALSLSLRK